MIDAVATASGQTSLGNPHLSIRVEQQADSLKETDSSTEDLTSTVKRNADNAHQAIQSAETVSEIAIRSDSAVAELQKSWCRYHYSAMSLKLMQVHRGAAIGTPNVNGLMWRGDKGAAYCR